MGGRFEQMQGYVRLNGQSRLIAPAVARQYFVDSSVDGRRGSRREEVFGTIDRPDCYTVQEKAARPRCDALLGGSAK